MADSFQPKFVDLVRNFTFTSGTGNLALGEAVPGFTGITEALQPGDRFYYSVAGLEKTSETEVGRGTLLSDGSVRREAIGGALTNFSQGRKSIALVAAAEWFGDVSEAAGAAPRSVGSREALAAVDRRHAALLCEPGREGLFLFDPSDRSAEVAADRTGAMFIAPASDPTGASGAWARKLTGAVNPGWFGLVEGSAGGANAAVNDSAWQILIAVLRELAVNKAATYQGLPPVQFDLGTYEFSAPIDLSDGAITISGRGVGHGMSSVTAGPTRLKFYGSTGIRVQAVNTSGESTADSQNHMGANYTTLRDLCIEGNFSGEEAEYHGVHARATIFAENVTVRNFAGDAWRIDADMAATGGNACSSRLMSCDGWSSRNGLVFEGNNVNASTVLGGIFNQNRQWGIWDSSTLGSAYVGCEMASNGVTPHNDGRAGPASVVSHLGNWYAVIAGQEANASTNAPSGTTGDNSWWMYLKAGAPAPGRPAWVTGMVLRAGGCLRDDSIISSSVYCGCYAEQDEGKAQVAQRSLIMGGLMSQWVYQNSGGSQGSAIVTGGNDGTVDCGTAFQANSGSVVARLGHPRGNPAGYIVSGSHSTISPAGHQLRFDTAANNVLFTYGGSSATYAYLVSGPNTTSQFGSGAAVPHCLYAPRLAIGDVAGTSTNARRFYVDAAPPASGSRGQGEWIFHRGSTPNLIGWNCISAGSPGTWQALYGLTQLEAAGSGLKISASGKLLGRVTDGEGEVEEILLDADAALASDSDIAVPTQRAVKTYVDAASDKWTLAQSWTHSADVSEVIFTELDGANEILVIGRGLTMATAGFRLVHLSVDNGQTFHSASGDYVIVGNDGTETSNTAAAGNSPTTNLPRSVWLHIPNAGAASSPKLCLSSTPRLFVAREEPVNALRIAASTGNLTGGSIFVFRR